MSHFVLTKNLEETSFCSSLSSCCEYVGFSCPYIHTDISIQVEPCQMKAWIGLLGLLLLQWLKIFPLLLETQHIYIIFCVLFCFKLWLDCYVLLYLHHGELTIEGIKESESWWLVTVFIVIEELVNTFLSILLLLVLVLLELTQWFISKEYSSSLIWNLIDKSSWFVALQLLSCKTVGKGGMMREWRVMSNVENGIASMSRKVLFFQFVFCDVLQFASKRTKSKEIAV